jgi:hypothetical protein
MYKYLIIFIDFYYSQNLQGQPSTLLWSCRSEVPTSYALYLSYSDSSWFKFEIWRNLLELLQTFSLLSSDCQFTGLINFIIHIHSWNFYTHVTVFSRSMQNLWTHHNYSQNDADQWWRLIICRFHFKLYQIVTNVQIIGRP